MKKTIEHLGIPAYLTLCTDNGATEISSPGCQTAVGDVKAGFAQENGQLTVSVTAGHTPVRWLKLRWKAEWPDNVRFLGDAWERGYGELEWRGMSVNRFMPWYF